MSAAAPSTRRPLLVAESAAEPFGESPADPSAELGDGPAADPTAELLAAPAPDPRQPPLDDDDSLFELEEEIASLSAHIDAAVFRLLTLVAEFDRRGGWKIGGHRSCAHWLSFRTGVDLGTAREKVRTARALESLPKISEEMARGRLSFSQARALTRVATPESEAELLEVARSVTVSDLERFIRAWRVMSRKDEAELERERWRSRGFSVFPDELGMYEVRGKLPAEVGAVLMRAVEAAGDALFTKESAFETAARQRRADAIGLVAERALAAGFGGECAERVSCETREAGSEPGPELESGAKSCGCDNPQMPPATSRPGESTPVSGSRAERYQVVLHVEPKTLAEEGEGGRSKLEDGTRVSPEAARRLSCDTSVVEVRRGTNGQVLDVGRRTRTVPPAIRRALEIRDRGCRFPGCGLRFADAHHVRHWADGGETKLDNLILLCRFHHRLLHEEGWSVVFRGGTGVPAFYDPRGHMHLSARPRSPGRPERPAKVLVRENRRRGVDPDGSGLTPRYTSERDVPLTLYEQAFEALAEDGAGAARSSATASP